MRIGKLLPFCLCVVPSFAQAHPHVWVEMRTDVVADSSGLIAGINVEWSFDDVYAQQALVGIDVDGDGEYTQEELKPLTQENMDSLKDYGYFNVMWGNGKLLETAEPINAGQTYNGNKLQLHFTVPLKQAYDAHNGEFKVKIYDPEFFIAFDYSKELPTDIEGKLAAGCSLELKAVPTDAELNTTLTMLSTKDKEWKPESGEDYGSLFAQPLTVSCTN